MNERHAIDDEIETLLGGRDTPTNADRGRAIAEQRLDQAIARRAPRLRRRRLARPPLAIAFAAALVLVSGVAVAATTDWADRILGSTGAAADRIEVVREDPRPDMTQDELMEMFRRSSVREHIGDRLDGELSAPLVQDARARLSARRTANGDVCTALYLYMSYSPDEPASWRPGAASCGTFRDGWPLMEGIGARNEVGTMSYGLVADGVAQVRFLVDGKTLDATMGEGAFLWRHPDGAKPTDIEAVLDDGTVVRQDLTWAHGPPPNGPPPAPNVVG
jgi:hypothetical protein